MDNFAVFFVLGKLPKDVIVKDNKVLFNLKIIKYNSPKNWACSKF